MLKRKVDLKALTFKMKKEVLINGLNEIENNGRKVIKLD